MIKDYIQLLHRRSGVVILFLLVLTTFSGIGVWKLFGGDLEYFSNAQLRYLRLRVDTSDDLFLASRDVQLQKYRESTRIFGDDRFLVALLEFDNVYTPDNLALIARISTAVGNLPGAKRVSSLTHEPVYTGTAKAMDNSRLAQRLPKTQADADRIKETVKSNKVFVNNLVSEDGRYAAVIVRTWPHVRSSQLDFLVKRFEQAVKLEARNVPVKFAGNHVQTIELHKATLQEMKRLLPVTAVVIFLFMMFVFRSWVRVALLMTLMGFSLVWTFGFLGWLGKSMTPIDVILPTLLMTLSTTYALQFLTQHMHLMDSRRKADSMDRLECCEAAAEDSFFPLFIAQLTTTIGTASLCLTDIPAIRQFGMLSSVGTIFTAVLIYTFLPVAVLLIPMRPRVGAPEGRWMGKLADFSQKLHKNKTPTLIVAFGLTLVLAGGLFHLRVENDPKTFFKPAAPIRQAIAQLDEKMGGALSLSVVFDGSAPGVLKAPEMLRQIEELQKFVSQEPHVLKSLSLVDTIKRLNRAVHRDLPEYEKIPEQADELSQLLLLAIDPADPSGFDRYVDYDYQRGRLEVRVKNVGSEQTLELAGRIQNFMDERWPKTLTGYVTGDHYMSCRANDAILKGQIKGFLWTAVAVFVVMWICFGSAKVGFLAMVPNVAPIAAVLGLMGYMGVQIDMGTALLASVALGIALDDTIHFIVHYMRNIQTRSKGYLAVRDVVGGVGRAMVFTNVALALGFGVLLISDFAPVRLFGLFMVVAMAMACFDDFVMMPGLLGWIPLIGIWEQWRIKFKSDVTQGIPLFANIGMSDIKKVVCMGRLMTVPEKWPLMQEGTLGDEMFVVLDGSVSVRKHGKTITRLGRGETVGEMGLISEHPRSADVLVNEETTVFAFGYEALERLERRYPRLATKVLHNLAAILSGRLAATTEQLL